MCLVKKSKSASTETRDGKLSLWGDRYVEEDEMSAYVELTEIILRRVKFIEFDGSGDKKFKLPMRKSLFAHVPPYIIFNLYNMEGTCALPPQITKHLQWRSNCRVPQMVRRTVTKSGFKFVKNDEWCGSWGPPMTTAQLKRLKVFQRVNHIPGILELCHKDLLWKNLNRMTKRFGTTEFSFIPVSFVLPEDTRKFVRFFNKHRGIWITKPPAGCSGNGIRVVSNFNDVPKDTRLVIQRYINRPRLIQGVKFDMRLYALITSVDPLRIYFYNEGLVRFATSKYVEDVHNLYDKFMHLTNTSVNKISPMFRSNDSVDKCKGNMWSLKSLWSYLAGKQRANVPRIWEEIKDIVIKTVISAEATLVARSHSTLPSNCSAYQLLGFDIILDDNFKPWLLEVNNYPSMEPDTPLCLIVKGQLAKDFLNIVGFQIPNKLSDNDKKVFMDKYDQSPICHDRNLETRILTVEEKDKQNRFANVSVREDYLGTIIDTLTPDDVRQLIRYEDEVTQVGGFDKIFPTKDTHSYHKFFDNVRYYNKLLDAWEYTYGSDKTRGISRLQKLCDKEFHLPGTENLSLK